jgi:hypothetical protein
MRQYARDGFVAPSALDPRLLHRLDGLALDAAADFDAVALSPVAPLGVCSALAPTSQDRTLTANRGTEVVSDPTNVLALECARRLAQSSARSKPQTVRLCALHQVLRAQPLPPQPGFSRHFRLFALAEAGRALPDDGFEVAAIARHVGVFDRLFDRCAALGCQLPDRRATLFVTAGRDILAQRIRDRLAHELPHVDVVTELFASRYYDGVRVLFGAHTCGGEFAPIGDTGRFDWVAKLASNRRLRFVASGLGIQLIPILFRPRDAASP